MFTRYRRFFYGDGGEKILERMRGVEAQKIIEKENKGRKKGGD